jgi:hypothetical protein
VGAKGLLPALGKRAPGRVDLPGRPKDSKNFEGPTVPWVHGPDPAEHSEKHKEVAAKTEERRGHSWRIVPSVDKVPTTLPSRNFPRRPVGTKRLSSGRPLEVECMYIIRNNNIYTKRRN